MMSGELYVLYLNHMDLTWRRPRYVSGHYDGYSIVPYSEIQERQIEAALDFVRAGGQYDLEQTISLREYLEHNPDAYEEIRQMIAEGKFHILGGGESVIDYNMPTSEALIRNHMYSRRWLKSAFDVEPRFAACPDTFGLSGGLPTLFKQLGYQGLSQYHRVFLEAKPFWQGISGDVIPLLTAVNQRFAMCKFNSFVKSRVCEICRGEGCPACDYQGYYPVYNMHGQESLQQVVSWIQEKQKEAADGDCIVLISGEEAMVPADAFAVLQQAACETGMHLHPIGVEELIEKKCGDLLEKYKNDTYAEEEVDCRQEGNPVGAGCYTSRIKMKQATRRCEAVLLACERLAAAVDIAQAADGTSVQGRTYPRETMEVLWRQMQVLNFHDGVTSSHSDSAYDELMELARQLCARTNRITNRAMDALGMNTKENMFTVYNPLEFEVKNVLLQGVVDIQGAVNGGRVVDPDGHMVEVVSIQRATSMEYAHAVVEFYGSLPAFGYKTFRFLPEEADISGCSSGKKTVGRKKVEACSGAAVLENEHLRVVFYDYEVDSVVDKHTGKQIAKKGTFAPIITNDIGHLWGMYVPGSYQDNVVHPCHWENMMPAHEFSRSMETQSWEGGQRVIVHIRYSRLEQNLNMLDWTAVYELPVDSEELHVHISTAFDATNMRLSTQVTLPEAPQNGQLEYEIPLGKIKRGVAEATSDIGYSDDWAALHYVCAQLDGVNVLLCNSGTPAHKLNDNVIATSLLRTPTELLSGFGIEGAIDTSVHDFTFTLSAASDRDIVPYRRGAALNALYPVSRKLPPEPMGAYMPLELPDNAPMLTLKKAEEGEGYIVRYLGIEHPVVLRFERPVRPTSILEADEGEYVTEAELPPFGIRSFRIE